MLLHHSKLFATLVLLAAIPRGITQKLNEPCTNPLGQPGRCVPLRQCQPLLDIYRKNDVSYGEGEFFYGSRCLGKSEDKLLLCCSPAPPLPSTVLPRAPSDCGLNPPDRIFGGTETALGEFSWTALLVYIDREGYEFNICGASLINSRYVVTAAHCIRGISSNLTLIGVLLGEHNTTNDKERDCDESGCANVPVEFGIEKVIVHEEYNANKKGQYNDIALIRMDRDVAFSDYINPICLPIEDNERQTNHTGRKATAAGWGLTEFTHNLGELSNVKLKVNLDVVDHQRCAKAYKNQFELRETQLCAGGKKGKDTCQGDSGGPLMRAINGNYYLIGVISHGPTQCGAKNVPALYTNVNMFVDWIQNNLE